MKSLSDLRQTIAELREKEKCATPCPWYVSSRGLDRDNEVANVRGVLIGGPRSAISCGDEAVAIVALRNSAPRLLDVLSKALDVIPQLERIAAHGYGLQGIQEDGGGVEEERDYFSAEYFRLQGIAREALSAFHKSIEEGKSK